LTTAKARVASRQAAIPDALALAELGGSKQVVGSSGSLLRGSDRFLTQNRSITIEIGELGVFALGIGFDGDILDGAGLH
jgi:hypothetical protein